MPSLTVRLSDRLRNSVIISVLTDDSQDQQPNESLEAAQSSDVPSSSSSSDSKEFSRDEFLFLLLSNWFAEGWSSFNLPRDIRRISVLLDFILLTLASVTSLQRGAAWGASGVTPSYRPLESDYQPATPLTKLLFLFIVLHLL